MMYISSVLLGLIIGSTAGFDCLGLGWPLELDLFFFFFLLIVSSLSLLVFSRGTSCLSWVLRSSITGTGSIVNSSCLGLMISADFCSVAFGSGDFEVPLGLGLVVEFVDVLSSVGSLKTTSL